MQAVCFDSQVGEGVRWSDPCAAAKVEAHAEKDAHGRDALLVDIAHAKLFSTFTFRTWLDVAGISLRDVWRRQGPLGK